ncbi:MAG TPA: AMP-binding protein [Mycobacteriales bacterium]|nr:AMP-binding protein [Mycobacteriales bacterium]
MPAQHTGRLRTLAYPPGEEFIAAFDEAWDRGDAVLPLDPAAPAAVRDRLLAAVRPDEPLEPDVALVIATSGSTGEPKGVLLSRDAVHASGEAAYARIGRDPNDRWVSCLPWQHIGGLQVMLRARMFGLPLTILDRFDVDRFAAVDATLASIVPTQLARLLDAGVDLSRFRVILVGGAATPAPLLARALDAGAPIVTTYGMSETCGGCAYSGVPLDGIDIRLGPGGRIEVRGPTVMSGYRLRPDLSEQALVGGWLLTADIGAFGRDGRLDVRGRVDDVVISGGENVVTTHVAAVLSGHPALDAVAVTGVDDPEWGQRVVAVAVVRPGQPTPTLAEVREWCADRLDPPSRPRGLVVVANVPMLGSGKPDRQAIRRLAERADRPGQAAEA